MSLSPSFSATPLTGKPVLPVIFTDLSTDPDPIFTKITNPSQMHFFDISMQGLCGVACVIGGYVYATSDYGATWVAQTNLGVGNWCAVTSTGYSNTLLCVANATDGKVYKIEGTLLMPDGSSTWTASNLVSLNISSCITCNANKELTFNTQYVVVGQNLGHLWIAQITGFLVFSELSNSPTGNWIDIDMSEDGTTIIATKDDNSVWISYNTGMTWTQQTVSGITGNNKCRVFGNTDSSYSFFVGGYGISYMKTMNSSTGVWSDITSLGEHSWVSLSKSQGSVGLDPDYHSELRYLAAVALDSSGDDHVYVINPFSFTFNSYDCSANFTTKKVAISSQQDSGFIILLAQAPVSLSLQDLYKGIYHVPTWSYKLEPSGEFIAFSNLKTPNQPHLNIGSPGLYSIKMQYDVDFIIAMDYIDTLTAQITHTVVVSNGAITSWTTSSGGTYPTPPNTHTINIQSGLIQSWTVDQTGSYGPQKTNVATLDGGLIQNWTQT